jgi:chaperonin GroES
VLVNPGRAIPVEFEGDNKLFIVPVEDLVAVVRKPEQDDD